MSSDNLVGLYVTIAVYFLLLSLAAVFAYRWKINQQSKAAIQNQHDSIESHFLANRSFGAILTAGSVFVSVSLRVCVCLYSADRNKHSAISFPTHPSILPGIVLQRLRHRWSARTSLSNGMDFASVEHVVGDVHCGNVDPRSPSSQDWCASSASITSRFCDGSVPESNLALHCDSAHDVSSAHLLDGATQCHPVHL